MKDAIIFDTETTGLLLPSCADVSKQPYIIELGAIRISGGKVVGEYTQLVHPQQEISATITKITGITNERLDGQPAFAAVVDAFADFVRGAEYIIAHNAPFDMGMLGNELARNLVIGFPTPPTVICTVQEFSYLRGSGKRLRLVDLYELTLGKPLEQKHRALDDCHAVREILDARNFWETLS